MSWIKEDNVKCVSCPDEITKTTELFEGEVS